jgi:hypothetical protein
LQCETTIVTRKREGITQTLRGTTGLRQRFASDRIEQGVCCLSVWLPLAM